MEVIRQALMPVRTRCCSAAISMIRPFLTHTVRSAKVWMMLFCIVAEDWELRIRLLRLIRIDYMLYTPAVLKALDYERRRSAGSDHYLVRSVFSLQP